MGGEIDLRGAVEKLKEMMSSGEGREQISGIISALSGSEGGGEKPREQTAMEEEAADFEMMVKMGKVLESVKRRDTGREAELLYALKPYLRESRRAKTDNAVRIMGMIKAFSVLRENGFDFGF